MKLGDLLAIYLIAGLACAVAIYRTAPDRSLSSVASALIAVPLWPLWAPIALTAKRGSPTEPAYSGKARPAEPEVAASVARIDAALHEAMEACAGSSLATLLPQTAADRILAEVRRAAARHAEIGALLAREGFDLRAAEARLAELTKTDASPRAISTARLHLDYVRRLQALRERDAKALDELSDLVQALRAQLTLARLAGSQPEGAGGIVSELWARVEGLGVALGAEEAPAEVSSEAA
ncbi:MAG: hypothetical protein U0441_14210 [Polyangiaceae bacterium]